MEPLTCPKCQAMMRTYERSGVTIDQCTQCGGLFLDRGELERLSEAEARFARSAAPPPPPPAYPQQGYPQPGYYPQQGGFLGSLFGGHHGRGHHGGHH